ncbi:MAG: hypothetical protein COW19_08255 [Zetaproteobacteria bacterium CG12_big_fil_rev_8_21_14_0_65_55_1124]|nr:MAG: hypothetical protein AUJ58_03775 [Zetaproteobacteria bacterium CG1_02_55_237]PIS20322.1 MAG: hypothetical protein COT53_00910 [Zetaproteobacteria bacterium CG08_land_8_20_14_0_20_55_17]PIW42451.1 MAG: hypothetical protein COW19_08255 [Zetaproteobacteria bacterium CG12_big_fil_rev_8_21_14_0_65_55_1124]PIY52324.1 MAG: hypothetical protein COZ01_07950 [Zetaproteobacteria bacterium CG_4_10_14_0_8_um_filter_55_43]PIZ37103.1 MAG: hypothetical protein COY36_10050 [Zetaproteobacteria bacterium 
MTALIFSAISAQAATADETYQTFDLGIESMRSHGYSVAIFIFMMIAIAVFVGIVWSFISSTKGEKIKRGEYVLFGMIILGVIAASIFAAVQLLDGVLF